MNGMEEMIGLEYGRVRSECKRNEGMEEDLE
jgi:hypothetical protein